MEKNNVISLKELLEKAPKIHDIINSYYNLSFQRKHDEYWTQQGINDILDFIDNNIVNDENLNEKWHNKICEQIERRLNLKVKGATLGMVPNYGGIIELARNPTSKECVELHFYVSFLKNVYSIQIVYLKDNMHIKRPQPYLKDLITKGIKTLVVSPIEDKYYKEYKIIESIIEANFENPIFLPYSIEKLRLNGLEVTYMEGENCLIGEAFFYKAFPVNYHFGNIQTIVGDENYKIDLLK